VEWIEVDQDNRFRLRASVGFHESSYCLDQVCDCQVVDDLCHPSRLLEQTKQHRYILESGTLPKIATSLFKKHHDVCYNVAHFTANVLLNAGFK